MMNRNFRLQVFLWPSDYREDWLHYMSDNIENLTVSAVYAVSSTAFHPFTIKEEKENLKKQILNGKNDILNGIMSIIKFNPDLIFFHGYSPLSFLIPLIFAIILRKKYTLFSDTNILLKNASDNNILKRILLKIIIKKAHTVFFSSSVNKRYWESRGADKKKLKPLYFPVNNDKIRGIIASSQNKIMEIRKKYSKDGKKIIVFCGRVVKEKNLPVLFKALKKSENTFLILVGDGPLMDDMISLSKNLGIEDKLFFTGKMGNQEAVIYIAAGDIFVLPSNEESFGLVLNEAILAGKPIVASDTCGAAYDLVVEGETGHMFKNNDADSLNENIEKALNIISDKHISVRSELMEKFSYKKNAEVLKSVVNEIKGE